MTELVLEDHGSVALLRFEGSERLNPFSRDTYTSFERELERIAADARWKALILTGAGRAFCSGQDLDEAAEVVALSPDALRARLEQLQSLTRRMRDFPKLLLAAVNGPAVGFGAELTLACDVRFASEDAYFMFPELSRGLYFTNATLELLPAFAGTARACELLLGGERWPATEALAAGFVSRVVPGAELLPAAQRFAAKAAQLPSEALISTLRFIRRRQTAGVDAALRYEVDAFLELRACENNSTTATVPATGNAR
jgi:2-(1,2-epoxy-1,2-dihydrophenyl)acetyl-CoA isomerase